MEIIKLRDDYIMLGLALTAAGVCGSGVVENFVVKWGFLKVNGQVQLQRGKKLVNGDIVEYNGQTIKITV